MSEGIRLGDPMGIALITVLVVASLVSLVGLGLALVLTIGQLAARNHRDGAVLLAAADAALELAADSLTTDDWQAVLGGWLVAAAADGAPGGLREVDGQTIDLAAETNLLNCGHRAACSPAERAVNTTSRPWGVNNPSWQLYLFGPLLSLVPLQASSDIYVLVWIADDSRETDGRPDLDGGNNPGRHVLRVRSTALGRDGARRMVEAELVRICLEGRSACEPGIRVQSQREERHALP
jgi:Tfp pilus assembly protein PilV